MNKKVKLVVADLDGTLIITGHSISDENARAINYLHEKGILFGIASGRNLFDLHRLPAKWGFDSEFEMYIGMNGSELWDGIDNKQYDQFKLEPHVIEKIYHYVEPFNINPYVYYKDGMMVMKSDPAMEASARRNDMVIYLAETPEQLWQTENAKVLCRLTEEQVLEVQEYFAKVNDPDFKLVQTQSTMLEFVHPEVSKAYALKLFCQAHNIDLNEVIAFGDMENDNDMLEACYGISMLNGSAETKAVSKEITAKNCEDDGFADWIFKNI